MRRAILLKRTGERARGYIRANFAALRYYYC